MSQPFPTVLVIDDLFGRSFDGAPPEDRVNLCAQYLLEDISDDVAPQMRLKIREPIASAVFVRGQTPADAHAGDRVTNDPEGTLALIGRGSVRPDGGSQSWALVLLDLCFYTGAVTEESERRRGRGMPEGDARDDDPQHYFGLELLEAIHARHPDLPVVILSSMSRDAVRDRFVSRGAVGFLPKERSDSRELLREYLRRHGLLQDPAGEIIGSSRGLLSSLRTARKASETRRNVLIRGERGTGKDLLARYISRGGGLPSARPFVIVNSAVLSSTLFASELFGIERGVATGVDPRKGLIVAADTGDLFFDEIRDMSVEAQAGILRVLEDGEVRPVGARRHIDVDVRFLSATNADIEAAAAAGHFRADLLDRLREGGTIVLPPLRERREDIRPLAESFVAAAIASFPGALPREIASDAYDRMEEYSWPGNIRELRSRIFEAVSQNPDVDLLVARHLRLNAEAPTPPSPPPQPIENVRDPLNAAIEQLNALDLSRMSASTLVGRLPDLQRAYARAVAAYLRAAIAATVRVTPQNPVGEVLIHPAAKLITADSTLTASRAADLFKRLMSIAPELRDELLSDPLLRSAYETSLRLRPSGKR